MSQLGNIAIVTVAPPGIAAAGWLVSRRLLPFTPAWAMVALAGTVAFAVRGMWFWMFADLGNAGAAALAWLAAIAWWLMTERTAGMSTTAGLGTANKPRPDCPGNARHWYSVRGNVGLRTPVCVRCGGPNPRKLSEDDWANLVQYRDMVNRPFYQPELEAAVQDRKAKAAQS